eukprot:5203688-Pleurochrysis_carterae.AAC.1
MDDKCDASKHLLCESWDGTQGAEFVRLFAPQFEAPLHITHLSSPAYPHPGAVPAGARSQATTPAEDKYIESERAYKVRSKKLFGLLRGHVTDPPIIEESETTTSGNGKSAWATLQSHGQPPRTGLTNIGDDSRWYSLRLSDVGINERTITKIVAKINQINLERESTQQ